MGAYYVGPRLWPMKPTMRLLHRGGERVTLFLAESEESPTNLALLEKILQAVNLGRADGTWWVVCRALSWGRLQVIAGQNFWVFGAELLPVSVGVYDLGGRRFMALAGRGPFVWRLPSLSEMNQNPDAKKEAWRWLRLLNLGS